LRPHRVGVGPENPRKDDPNTPQSAKDIGERCDPYWANWGFNRVALLPVVGRVSAPGRSGFYIHDSAKSYTHGCIETELQFFNDLIVWIKANPNAKLQLTVKYTDDFRTYGGTSKTSWAGESSQRDSLVKLEEMCSSLRRSSSFNVSLPVGLNLSPPPQDRLVKPVWRSDLPSGGFQKLNELPDAVKFNIGDLLGVGDGRAEYMASKSFI